MRLSSTRPRALVVAAMFAATVGLAACSGTDGGAEPSPAPTDDPPASTAPTDAASPSPSPVATLPVTQCLDGSYALVRFVAVGGETYGTGQGGDVTMTFDDGSYTLTGAGAKPMVVTTGGQSGNLTVDGRAKGTYTLKGDTATFAEPTATGSGTLSGGSGGAQKLTMKQVLGVIGPSGDGKVACTAQAMTITLNAIRLELGRT